jgi:ubiquinone/menaquinone biosynthesis C-methylase UbiE
MIPNNLQDVVEILRCPISGAALRFMPEDALAQVRELIARGELQHAAGGSVRARIEAALTSGEYIYPVSDGIIALLPGVAIVRLGTIPRIEPDLAGVMKYYDELGWQETDGQFEEVTRYEDQREIALRYILESYERVQSELPRAGDYLLDVASGPIPYPEYFRYSENYKYRLCVDFSSVALRAARKRLGDRGVYIQGDITQLPFKDGAVDSFMSLHTIYHVPAERQPLAFRELERVLKPGGKGVVVYSWGSRALAMEVLMRVTRPLFTLKSLVRKAIPDSVVRWLKGPKTPAKHELPLYFAPHDYAWFQREVASRPGWELRVWRAASYPFLLHCVRPGAVGRAVVNALLYAENAWPRLCGRIGQYPMMVYRKSAAEQTH